ncbi:radical SAM protein [Clostridium beijerinckii]|uniref:radical SAM protein n=1 Tax=Clostridium beijerinckii TaxID=1520 RepID=UPI001494D32E|nr:radical SAM protein [Clostridium beijerinckii]NOW06638.1 radical SAM protein with 4Fe4S-binding SPASM domain [Clostridium beijerinckii]NYC00218.1 radical SAM protein with 4Fe4S-binding SPASM domain [Clostridium beijerinckii]
MQPRTSKKFDRKSLDILKKAAENTTIVSRGLKSNKSFCTELPLIVGFKLTNKCNLRCKTCYEWNEEGYHHNMTDQEQRQELDIDIFEKVINETKGIQSNLYLWGGEPLVYSEFDKISRILELENRIVAICTNGQLIHEKMDSILRLGEKLELLIAVDGFEEENDEIRGKGTFKKVLSNIKELLSLRRKGVFKGKISLHCVINEDMVHKLYDFLEFFEELGIDSIVLCYPWYISECTSLKMDSFYSENLGSLNNHTPSWHAFKYKLPIELYEKLLKERKRILDRTWKLQVRFQPDLSEEGIHGFLNDKLDESLLKYNCYSVADRMEVLPNGYVSSCKHFPELIIGDLSKDSVYDIWHGENYTKTRKVIQKQLMPVCTKCNNLYLHGRKIINEK